MATSDVVNAAAAVASEASPPLPASPPAGERSVTETGMAPPTQARPEASLLGAELPRTEEEKSDIGVSRSQQEAKPSYGEFKLPEGVTLDAEQLRPATELFAESGLSQEQAQKFIDLAVARESAAAQRGVQAFVELQNRWVAEVKADPDIGGDKLTAALAAAARGIDRLEVPGLREALSFTGAGNHPAVVRAFVRLGQMLSEDRFRPAPPVPPAPPRTAAEVIYDGTPKGSADGL